MNRHPALAKLVIICGTPAGGNTLLLDMLRAHSRVFAPNQVGLLGGETQEVVQFDPRPKGPTYGYYETPIAHEHFGFDEAELLAIIEDVVEEGGSWPQLYGKVFEAMTAYWKIHGRDVLVDKSPYYSGHLLERVYPKMPDVPTLVVVKDPRAYYCSHRKREWYAASPEMAVAEYSQLIGGALAAVRAGKRVLLVRFDDLVLRPEEQMRRIAEFVGLDYDPAMTSPANSYAQFDKTRFTYPHWIPEKRSARPVGLDRSAVAEWRDLLDPADADAIVAALPEELEWALCDSGKDMPQVEPAAV